MPEIRHYVVTQTREVEVSANSEIDAARIAAAAFEHGQSDHTSVKVGKGPEGIWGNTTSHIRNIELVSKEKRIGR